MLCIFWLPLLDHFIPLPMESSTSEGCRVKSSGVKFSRTRERYSSREWATYLLHDKDNSKELLGNPNHNPSQFEFHFQFQSLLFPVHKQGPLINRKGGEKLCPVACAIPRNFSSFVSTHCHPETNPKGPSVFQSATTRALRVLGSDLGCPLLAW